MLIKRFERNTLGRDIAIGDIHGCWQKVNKGLKAIGYDPEKDRLFGVGDLGDRGPQSPETLWWLKRLKMETVVGNHDQYIIDWRVRPGDKWAMEGGEWFQKLSVDYKEHWATEIGKLPVGIEIETEEGLVCIVHADVMFDTWEAFKTYLHHEDPRIAWMVRNSAQGSRNRYLTNDKREITDIRALVVGHCRVKDPLILGNVHHIDTEGWKEHRFTFYDLATLQAIPY
jgi:serine/threonine protein phosphatase 1